MQGTEQEEHSERESGLPAGPVHDPYAALRERNFRLFLSGNLVAILGLQMQTVAVGWEIYERTGSAMALGLIGLAQVTPVISLALLAGHVADRFERRNVLVLALSVISLASAGLALISAMGWPVLGLYGCLILNGSARAFYQPAKSSLLPQIVPRRLFANAVMWSTGSFQLSSVLGPALGGLLISLFRRPSIVYLLDSTSAIAFVVLLLQVRPRPMSRSAETASLASVIGGARFLWRNQVLLGAMALDLFAVLLGGAITLLPVYAKDILQVGPVGLGWMQAAPAVGALLMSLAMAHRPPLERAGRALLLSVAGFGIATIVFGLSRSLWLSLTMLLLTGAFDTVSVIIRHTLVQMLTPDQMRGRVSAINGMFIGASNELGGFESGLVAHVTSPTWSVVLGGAGTLAVVFLASLAWPKLRRYGRLDGGGSAPAKAGSDTLQEATPAAAAN